MTQVDTDVTEFTPIKAILADIAAYEREYRPWIDRAKGCIDRYRDVRPEPVNQTFILRKFNILWSNVETLQPTLYARLPQTVIERRFNDADPVGKLACEIGERLGNYVLETSAFDQIMRQCVKDRLLPGRGLLWIGYDSQGDDVETDDDVTDEAGNPIKNDDGTPKKETAYQKMSESVVPRYIDWKDWGHSPVRTWDEVKTIWRNVYMTEEELKDRFPDEWQDIPLDRKLQDSKEQTDFVIPQAVIREVYYKPTRKVYWVHTSVKDEPLDEADPPVDFEDFWSCPKPLWSTLTNDTLIPIPDFIYYQDQANELDIVTNRIARLTDALKAVGVYDASQPKLERILQPNGTPDNMLVPVDSWAQFMEKGGLAGSIQLVPIDTIVATLQALYEARTQIINVIYQVTGIADIIRGSTDPNETATAQNIKGQFASLRIRDTQAEVARFARDAIRLIIECGVRMFEPNTIADMVMAENFCPMTQQEQQLRQLAQTPQGQAFMKGKKMPPPQSFTQALQLMKDDKLRSFHIDIETDSTIAMNEQEEKQQATEFVTTIATFLGQAEPMLMQAPMLAPLVGETLQFLTRRYRAGRSLETTIDKVVQAMEQKAANPPPPQPDLAMQKQLMAAQNQIEQGKVQLDKKNNDLQATQAQIETMKKELLLIEQKLDMKSQMLEQKKTLAVKEVESTADQRDLDHMGNVLQFHQKQLTDESKQNQQKADAQTDTAGALSAMTQMAKFHADAMNEAMSRVGEHTKALSEAVQHLNKPRKLIRDPKTGKAIGSEV